MLQCPHLLMGISPYIAMPGRHARPLDQPFSVSPQNSYRSRSLRRDSLLRLMYISHSADSTPVPNQRQRRHGNIEAAIVTSQTTLEKRESMSS